MIEIKTEVTIDSPVDKVWEVLTDFESYPRWNPFMKSVSGHLAVGNKLEVTICPPGGKPMSFKPIVVFCEPHQEFRWVGKILAGWIFNGEHYFKLEKLNEQKTRFIHGEYFSGVLAKPLMHFIKDKTRSGFELMNAALKNTIDSLR